MAIKTVQIFDPSTPLDLSPNFDRLNASIHPEGRAKLAELVERGELPRYRGDETQITVNEDSIVVTMDWRSREVAQEYVDFCTTWTDLKDPARLMRSIEIIEV